MGEFTRGITDEATSGELCLKGLMRVPRDIGGVLLNRNLRKDHEPPEGSMTRVVQAAGQETPACCPKTAL
jgi:hypothetical protein